MKIGLIKPNYTDEKRVALLPEDISNFENELIIEDGFGDFCGISNSEYIKKGCIIKSREEVYNSCETIFNLKLIQESDYNLIKHGQMIIGWTHPTGSGSKFMEKVAIPKNLTIVDLDNIYPKIYKDKEEYEIPFLEPNFIWKNSYMAGYSSVFHAIKNLGVVPNSNTNVAILSSGNVAQGAIAAISKFSCNTRLFYRKTMNEFTKLIGDYDIIINGIETEGNGDHIITIEDIKRTKKDCIIIDAAADAGGAIEGTHYTTITNPIYFEEGRAFFVVNNSPSIFYKETSKIISSVLTESVFKPDVKRFLEIVK